MPDTSIFGGGGGGDQAEAYSNAAQVQADSARAAAEAQLQASRESNALVKEMYQSGRADLAPWRATGQTALDVYNRLLGLPSVYTHELPAVPGQDYVTAGGTNVSNPMNYTNYTNQINAGNIPRSMTYEDFLYNNRAGLPMSPQGLDPTAWIKQTPGYQFQYGEGLNALDRSAASKGMLLSGQQTRAAQEYGQNFALNQYDNYMNKLSNLAGIGQTTAGQTATLGNSMATQSAANTMTGAQNAAQSNMAGANAIGSGYVNAANANQANQNSLFNNIGSLAGTGMGLLSAWGGGAGGAAAAGGGLSGALSAIGGWFSDKRLKQNIHTADDLDSMALVEKLQPTYFDYLPGIGGEDQLGFIADDIEKIIPSAVLMRDGFRVINPVPIMAVLVKAIQSQQKQIDDLRGSKDV